MSKNVKVYRYAETIEHNPVPMDKIIWKRFNLQYKAAQTSAEKAAIEAEYESVKAARKKKSLQFFWELDNTILNKETGRREVITKYVCVPDPADFDRYKWTPMTYKEIAGSKHYGNMLVPVRGHVDTVARWCKIHERYKQMALSTKDSVECLRCRRICRDIKRSIDRTLDKRGRMFASNISMSFYTPEICIRYYGATWTNWDTPVGCYPYVESWYQGEENSVPNGVTEICTIGDSGYYEYQEYMGSPDIGSEFILSTNSDIKFGALQAAPWVKTIIARAYVFDLTPITLEGIYKQQGFDYTFDPEIGALFRRQKGVRGMCISFRHLKELFETVTWYEKLAESGEDLSPTVELHHINGIDVKTITRYEYCKHREDYEDWREKETRDFLEPLYTVNADGEEVLEEVAHTADGEDD